MTYPEVLEYLYSSLPMYQREGKSAFKKDLTNTIALLKELDDPHRKFKSIHVAGTNGKGTSAHTIAAILQVAGYKVGLYTSPHLKEFTERIKINGKEVGRQFVMDFVESNQTSIERIGPSFFETTVAMAFDYFAKEKVDVAVVETGLGGRLDSTNVLNPEICLITTIGLEHTDLLGDTVEKIAFEKAGIIKSKTPCVVGNVGEGPMKVIEEVAANVQARLIKSRERTYDFDLSKVPPYTIKNLPGVLALIDELKIAGWKISLADTKEAIENYPSLTGFKGRFQLIQKEPAVIADVSHNKDGLELLMSLISENLEGSLHVVFGTVKDKPIQEILTSLPKEAKLYFTQSHVPRSLPVEELVAQARKVGLSGESYENVNDAKKAALEKAASQDVVLVTGSTFVVAELDEL